MEKTQDDGRWELGPPPTPVAHTGRAPGFVWDPRVEKTKTRPGVWRTYRDQARSAASYVRERYPELLVESHDHHRDEHGRRRCTVWLCWPGEAAADEGAA